MLIFSRYALAVLLNAAWLVTLVYLLGLACAWMFRNSPRKQHIVWVIAFALSIVLPFAHPLKRTSVLAPARREAPLSPDSSAGKVVLGAYLATVLWAGTRLWVSWTMTRRIVANARSRNLPEMIESVRQRCGIPRVLFSSGQQGPLTIGARRPVVILPEALHESASEELLVSVLGHEGAHIQRRDFFWNALVESLYPWLAFHPCAALIRRRIRDTRELACDELVATHLIDRSRYAEALLEIALRGAEPAPALSMGTLGGFGSGNLEERIRRLAGKQQPEAGRSILAVSVSAVLLFAAATAPFAFGFQVPDPFAYTGAWTQNWGTAFRSDISVDLNDCCFNILEIRYENQKFTGSMARDTAGVQGNRVVRGPRLSQPIEDPVLENGVLRFRQTGDRAQQLYEITPTGDGGVMLRSDTVIENRSGWTRYARVQ
jgi:beta-lactamase regulating signal transducer with metallopeptidase domain